MEHEKLGSQNVQQEIRPLKRQRPSPKKRVTNESPEVELMEDIKSVFSKAAKLGFSYQISFGDGKWIPAPSNWRLERAIYPATQQQVRSNDLRRTSSVQEYPSILQSQPVPNQQPWSCYQTIQPRPIYPNSQYPASQTQHHSIQHTVPALPVYPVNRQPSFSSSYLPTPVSPQFPQT